MIYLYFIKKFIYNTLYTTKNNAGKISFTWFGPYPRVSLMDPRLVKEVLSNKFGHFMKISVNPLSKFLIQGLASYDGQKWAKHRRIINPAFHLDKLKVITIIYSCIY